MYMGQQLVDPDSIPPEPDGFDPVEFCRGARLRETRAAKKAARSA